MNFNVNERDIEYDILITYSVVSLSIRSNRPIYIFSICIKCINYNLY